MAVNSTSEVTVTYIMRTLSKVKLQCANRGRTFMYKEINVTYFKAI